MTKILTGILLIASLQGLPSLVTPLVTDGSGIVTGVVRQANTGQPIAEAQVAVIGEDESLEQAMTHAAVTDRDGKFTIKGVMPGERVIAAQAEGFFSISGDIPIPAYTSKDVSVNEGQQVDLGMLDLMPGATISGRLLTADGLPAKGATVQAFGASYIRGQLTFTLVKSTQTDDRGEYRLFWLAPGEYYVCGQYRANSTTRQEHYERVFFPGIREEDAAPPIAVGPGSEVSAIDIQVETTPVAGVAISGRVEGLDARDGADWRVTSIRIIPRDRRVRVSGDNSDVFPNQTSDSSQGAFEIRNVPPGVYTLVITVRDSKQGTRAASAFVDIADKDLKDVSAVLDSQVELRGRLTWDGEPPGSRLAQGSILLTPLDRIPGQTAAPAPIIPDAESGGFLVSGLLPGKYAVQLAASFRAIDTYIADIRKDGVSVMDGGFTIDAQSSGSLEIQLKSQGEVVSGTVLDMTRLRPFAHATVVLIPDPPRRQNFALYKQVVSAAEGTFSFFGVAPGSYKLLALESATPGVWQNPLFVEKYENRNLTVSIIAGSTKNIQLTIAP